MLRKLFSRLGPYFSVKDESPMKQNKYQCGNAHYLVGLDIQPCYAQEKSRDKRDKGKHTRINNKIV